MLFELMNGLKNLFFKKIRLLKVLFDEN